MNDTSQPIQIRTVAPIPTVDLKRKFTENVEFIIDVDNSRLKGRPLITWLSNLDIKARLEIQSDELRFDLLEEYMRSTLLVNIHDLNDLAMNICLAASGRQHLLDFDPSAFIEKNADLIETWLKRVYSIPVYALHCSPEHKDLVNEFEEDDSDGLVGLNFVKLIDHELFPLLMEGIREDEMCWNKTLFNEYIFGGDNLFKYFASKNNPYFLAIVTEVQPEDGQPLIEAMEKTLQSTAQLIEGIEHVSPAQ